MATGVSWIFRLGFKRISDRPNHADALYAMMWRFGPVATFYTVHDLDAELKNLCCAAKDSAMLGRILILRWLMEESRRSEMRALMVGIVSLSMVASPVMAQANTQTKATQQSCSSNLEKKSSGQGYELVRQCGGQTAAKGLTG